jgi:ribA/ribD-fused uncharacterized protein
MEAKLAEFQLRIEELEKTIEKHQKIFDSMGVIISGKKIKNKREKIVCVPAKNENIIRFGSTKDKEYGYLSLFYKAPFSLDGFEWSTVAHYMAAAKFLTTDPEYAEEIRKTENSAIANAKGKNKTHKADESFDFMKNLARALVEKFKQNESLAEKLVKIDKSKIFEFEDPKDIVLGIGADGKGENHLGKIIHKIRTVLLELSEEDDEENEEEEEEEEEENEDDDE